MCPSRWLTATSGTRWTYARDFATAQPTSSEPTSPGPWVTATPSSSRNLTPASASAFSTTGTMTSRWRREASSGTTPPYGAWIASCEATTLESTRRPSARTAAAVSSHELSMPSTIMSRSSFRSRSLQTKRGDEAGSLRPGLASPRLVRASRLLRPGLSLRSPRSLLLDDAHGLDHVQRALDLDVLAQLLHRIERRRPLLRGRILILRDLDDDVRGDPLAVDRSALGREVLRGRQAQSRAVRERNDRLDRALAEGLGADDDRAAPILERACHDLRRRRAALVDQHDHRQV